MFRKHFAIASLAVCFSSASSLKLTAALKSYGKRSTQIVWHHSICSLLLVNASFEIVWKIRVMSNWLAVAR